MIDWFIRNWYNRAFADSIRYGGVLVQSASFSGLQWFRLDVGLKGSTWKLAVISNHWDGDWTDRALFLTIGEVLDGLLQIDLVLTNLSFLFNRVLYFYGRFRIRCLQHANYSFCGLFTGPGLSHDRSSKRLVILNILPLRIRLYLRSSYEILLLASVSPEISRFDPWWSHFRCLCLPWFLRELLLFLGLRHSWLSLSLARFVLLWAYFLPEKFLVFFFDSLHKYNRLRMLRLIHESAFGRILEAQKVSLTRFQAERVVWRVFWNTSLLIMITVILIIRIFSF